MIYPTNGLSDETAYAEMTAPPSTTNLSNTDVSALISFGQFDLAPSDTASFVAAFVYSGFGQAAIGGQLDVAEAIASLIGPGCFDYVLGDANGDTEVNVGDVVYTINFIFKSGPPPVPEEAGDSNCDGTVNVGDAVYTINFVFKDGPSPCAP